MRYVIATDEEGYKRRYLIRDTDGDEDARRGIPSGPPDLDVIDWHALKREINNRLVDAGIFDWDTLKKSPEGIGIIATTVKQWISAALKADQAEKKTVFRNLHRGGKS